MGLADLHRSLTLRRRGRPRQKVRPRGQLDLFEQNGHVEQAGFERTRATFGDIIRAAELHRYDFVIVENVPDVSWRWELFDWWCQGMRLLGYNMQPVSVSSAHIGGDGYDQAAQWRNRLYLVFTREGIPLPDVAPRPWPGAPAARSTCTPCSGGRTPRSPAYGRSASTASSTSTSAPTSPA
ncbi:DNA cytosine methyltransferase [Catellatospora coxensis]